MSKVLGQKIGDLQSYDFLHNLGGEVKMFRKIFQIASLEIRDNYSTLQGERNLKLLEDSSIILETAERRKDRSSSSWEWKLARLFGR